MLGDLITPRSSKEPVFVALGTPTNPRSSKEPIFRAMPIERSSKEPVFVALGTHKKHSSHKPMSWEEFIKTEEYKKDVERVKKILERARRERIRRTKPAQPIQKKKGDKTHWRLFIHYGKLAEHYKKLGDRELAEYYRKLAGHHLSLFFGEPSKPPRPPRVLKHDRITKKSIIYKASGLSAFGTVKPILKYGLPLGTGFYVASKVNERENQWKLMVFLILVVVILLWRIKK